MNWIKNNEKVVKAVCVDRQGNVYLPVRRRNGSKGDLVISLTPYSYNPEKDFDSLENRLLAINVVKSLGLELDTSLFPYKFSDEYKYSVINKLPSEYMVLAVTGNFNEEGFNNVVVLNKKLLAAIRQHDAPIYQVSKCELDVIYSALI